MGRKVCSKCKGKPLLGRCQQTFENFLNLFYFNKRCSLENCRQNFMRNQSFQFEGLKFFQLTQCSTCLQFFSPMTSKPWNEKNVLHTSAQHITVCNLSFFASIFCIVLLLLKKFKYYIGCFQSIYTYCMITYRVKQKQIETEVFTIYVGGLVIH